MLESTLRIFFSASGRTDMGGRAALEFDQPGRYVGYAALAMRGLGRQERGGALETFSLDTHASDSAAPVMGTHEMEVLADALDDLARLEPDLVEIVDLKFFCGFTFAEVARMQDISERTVQRKWDKARAVLFAAISD